MHEKKTVLLFCATSSQFPELLPVGRVLRDSSMYDPIFVFGPSRDENNKCIVQCKDESIKCYNLLKTKDNANLESIFTQNNQVNIPKRRPSYIEKTAINILNYIYGRCRVWKEVMDNVDFCRQVIDLYMPCLLIIPIETTWYFYDSAVAIANKKNIPTIIVPFCFVKRESEIKWYIENPLFNRCYSVNSLYKRFVALLFPDWVAKYKGKKILRLEPLMIFAYWWYNIAKPNPWVCNDGFAKAVAVESLYIARLMVEEGVPENKIKVSGSPVYDEMFKIIANKSFNREKICKEIYPVYDNNAKLFLVSLPEYFNDLNARPGCEFESHYDVIMAFAQPLLMQKNIIVMFCLHPRLNYDEVKYIKELGAKIVHKPLAEILPLADIFITATSAAIRLAISCGVPVVDYDVFRYGDRYYSSAGGVVTISTRDQYLSIIDRLVKDEKYFNELRQRQEQASFLWGRPDGKAGGRILDLIGHVVEGKKH